MDKVVSTNELAEILGCTPAAISNYRRRHENFPKPVPTERMAVCYALDDVLEWLEWRGPRRIVTTETGEQHRMWLANLRERFANG